MNLSWTVRENDYVAKNVDANFAYHNLYLKFADLQIIFIVDIHPFKRASLTLRSSHQKDYGKTSCKLIQIGKKIMT